MDTFKMVFSSLVGILLMFGVSIAFCGFQGAFHTRDPGFDVTLPQKSARELLKVNAAFGAMVALTCLGGIIVVFKNQRAIQSVYEGILLGITALLLVFGLLTLLSRYYLRNDDHLRAKMFKYVVPPYGQPPSLDTLDVDVIQSEFKCCGVSDVQIYKEDNLPWSCCQQTEKIMTGRRMIEALLVPCNQEKAFRTYCDKVPNPMEDSLLVLSITQLCLGSFMLIQFVLLLNL